MAVFLDAENRRNFLAGVGCLVSDGALTVHAFCLMPNRHHVLCQTPKGGLARWMRYVNAGHGRRYNDRHGRLGHQWQRRYKAILVDDGEYPLECSGYIHLNPNHGSGLTRPAERYRLSIYRDYVGGPSVCDLAERPRMLGHFAGDRLRYRRYVEAGRGERPVSPFEGVIAGLAAGHGCRLIGC